MPFVTVVVDDGPCFLAPIFRSTDINFTSLVHLIRLHSFTGHFDWQKYFFFFPTDMLGAYFT
jgi:hypothetical protein